MLLDSPVTGEAATLTQKMTQKTGENFLIFSYKGNEKRFCFFTKKVWLPMEKMSEVILTTKWYPKRSNG